MSRRALPPPEEGPRGLSNKRPLSHTERLKAETWYKELTRRLAKEHLDERDAANTQRILDELGLMLEEDTEIKRALQGETTPPSTPVSGDRIDVHGDVKPGGNTGSGSVTIEGGAAGGNMYHITGGTFIENAQVVNGTVDAAPTGMTDMERTYLTRLLVASSNLPLGQIDVSGTSSQGLPDVKLEALYVPLDTTVTQRTVGGTEGERTPVSALGVAIRKRWLVVLGDPGSGKTTFLNYLTFFLAGARLFPDRDYLSRLNVDGGDGQRAATWSFGPLVPIRIDLREFVHDVPEDTKAGSAELVWSHVVRKLAKARLGNFARRLETLLLDGQCLVMFDGLDEIPDLDRRKLVCQSVHAFAAQYANSGSRVIVTCRALSYRDEAWKIKNFPAVMLAPLSQQSIETFITNWYELLERVDYLSYDESRERINELREAVPYLFDLASNPLLLTVMVMVHTSRGRLPRERVRLYHECINLLLLEWQQSKQVAPGNWTPGISEMLDVREERLVTGLCEVAFEAHRTSPRDETGISERAMFDILQKYMDGNWGKAQTFGRYVEERAGLLVSKGQGTDKQKQYGFVHRGFQEFLAGRYLIAGWEFARRAADLAAEGDIWHEVLLLAAGHLVFNLQQVTPALDAINLLCKPTTPTDDAGWRSVWLAGEMLHVVGRSAAEQDPHVGQEVLPRLTKHLTQLVVQGKLTPRERARAGDVLGLLGDPRPGVTAPAANKAALPRMVELSGGNVQIGPSDVQHNVRISPFKLAMYPVTNAQFRQFAMTDYNDNSLWTEAGIEWRTRTGQRRGSIYDVQWGIDNRPVVEVTWYEAVAYANWLRKHTGKPYRLPSEVEWERAAAGKENRRYPFGDTAREGIANYQKSNIGQTTAVGIFPEDRTPEGIYDLGGNVWEWTLSLGLDYPYRRTGGREDLEAAGSRIVRGGGYDSPRDTLHCTHRRPVDPAARVALIGFRVACDME